jgi:hypothetical protein
MRMVQEVTLEVVYEPMPLQPHEESGWDGEAS